MVNDNFKEAIKKQNEMYKISSEDSPKLLPVQRLKDFKSILVEEANEVDEIILKYENFLASDGENLTEEHALEILTELSDWLGDICVYDWSEARRWGLPMQEILEIIMQSNFSKLGQDGKPIYDERGKFMKGPNYWKPEPKIRELLGKIKK